MKYYPKFNLPTPPLRTPLHHKLFKGHSLPKLNPLDLSLVFIPNIFNTIKFNLVTDCLLCMIVSDYYLIKSLKHNKKLFISFCSNLKSFSIGLLFTFHSMVEGGKEGTFLIPAILETIWDRPKQSSCQAEAIFSWHKTKVEIVQLGCLLKSSIFVVQKVAARKKKG